MTHYLIRRLLQAIPTIFGVTLISFVLMMSTPGDPISRLTHQVPNMTEADKARLRRQLGLDKPMLEQYIYWLIGNDWTTVDVDGDGQGEIPGIRRGILRGDLGSSLGQRRPVLDLILERIPATLQLTLTAFVVGYVIGIPLGVAAALSYGRWFDQFARVISVLGNAVPSFWLALMLIMLFGVTLKWLPISGMRDLSKPNATFIDNLPYMVLPVTVLAAGTVASVSRFLRAKMLETMSQDYIRTAHAKGLTRQRVWWYHALRNALMPVATFIGPALGFLLSGAVIIETVFSWPGTGRLIVNAVFERDYPLIMGTVFLGTLLYIFGLLVSDLLYAALDPRVRLQ